MIPRYDTVIRDATVIDGTNAPRYRADVGIHAGRIAAIGDLGAVSADRVFNLLVPAETAMVVAPTRINTTAGALPYELYIQQQTQFTDGFE